MLKERSLTIRLDGKLHKAARLKSVESGQPLSEIMRVLLAGWVDGSITLPQPTEMKPEARKGSKT